MKARPSDATKRCFPISVFRAATPGTRPNRRPARPRIASSDAARRVRRWALLLAFGGVQVLQAAAPAAPAPGRNTPAIPLSANRDLQSLFNLGSTYTDRKDFKSAEIAYEQILRSPAATRDDQRAALLTLARLFRTMDANTRAAACYEKFLKEFPDDGNAPLVNLELGRALRAMGAYQIALARFYSVINSTLRLSEQGADQYRALAKTAQYEIAETHFEEGDFAAASKYFSRIQLLDLAEGDRTRAQFKAATALVLSKDYAGAERALRAFLDQNPGDENVAEARFLLSVSLGKLGRGGEALDVVLALLRQESARKDSDPRRWAYWQRRTGNQLANSFYEDGGYWSALTIYEALADLSKDNAEWRLPALYQAGLCYERLGQFDHAGANYQAVADGCAAVPPAERPGVEDVGRMAAWRLLHLGWRQQADTQIALLFGTIPDKSHEGPKPVGETSGTVR